MNIKKLRSLIKHLWLDPSDVRRALSPDMLQRLTSRVAASESRHTGQIRLCIEASLPASYLWRLSERETMQQLVQQRALMLFGKLRVWDTAQNNGVLVYLQLAEKALEIVADRGLNAQVPQAQWQAISQRMSAAFKEARFEDGLTQALEEVSTLLVAYFPLPAGASRLDELPDQPVLV